MMEMISESRRTEALIIGGGLIEDKMDEDMRVTMIATGPARALCARQQKHVEKTGTDNSPWKWSTARSKLPAVMRSKRNRDATIEVDAKSGVEMLDIPAVPCVSRRTSDWQLAVMARRRSAASLGVAASGGRT